MESSHRKDLVYEDYSEFANILTPRQIRKLEKKDKRLMKRSSASITQHPSAPIQKQIKTIEAKTTNQKLLISSLQTHAQVIATGPAGTGKTFVATWQIANMLLKGEIKKIVLTRPNVSCSKSIGLLPGDKNEKFANWTIPFTEVLKECMGVGAYECALKKNQIEIVPFEFMRGRTFNDAAVIVDECQSTTEEEICLLVTRIGENSKLIMLGDVRQKDIKNYSGLEYVIKATQENSSIRKNVALVEFTLDDIVRSDVCAIWAKHIYRS